MKRLLLINLVIFLLIFGIPQIVRANSEPDNSEPEACRNIKDTQRKDQCKACEGKDQQGTWVKIPIPIIFNPTINIPYKVGTDTLKDITYGGRCIHNPAIFFFMLYYLGLVLLAVFAVFTLMFGGYLYLISFGNTEKLGQAKTTMFSAIIGLIVGLLSYLMVDFLNPDLTSFHWGTERLSQELEKAMERIEKKSEEEEKKCPNVSGTSLECRNKKIRDICNLSPGGKGYCEKDANIQGCVCVANKCVNSCDQGKPACVGEKCLFPSGDYGQCVADPAGIVTCRDLNSVCGQGDCGGSAAQSWVGLNCEGPYPCGVDGLCMNFEVESLTGIDKCKALNILCNELTCGSDLYDYREEVQQACHGKRVCDSNSDGTPDVCFRGGCYPYSPGDVMCSMSADIGKACDGGGGNYGICAIYPPGHLQEGQPYCETAYQ